MWQDIYNKVLEEGEEESVEQAVVALELSPCLEDDRKRQEELILQALQIRGSPGGVGLYLRVYVPMWSGSENHGRSRGELS
jgi:hypothetical protein